MENNEITKNLLYALSESEDGKISLTVFTEECTATIDLSKDFAEGLIENLSRYVQLLK